MPRRKPDPARDAAFMEDMLEAARAVASFVAGRSRDDYARDLLLRSAVERQVGIIGEAAANVSQRSRAQLAEIPWDLIVNQRHRVIHEYGRLDDDKIWRVATEHVPILLQQLQKVLPDWVLDQRLPIPPILPADDSSRVAPKSLEIRPDPKRSATIPLADSTGEGKESAP